MVQASEKRFGNDAANSLDSACNRRILVEEISACEPHCNIFDTT